MRDGERAEVWCGASNLEGFRSIDLDHVRFRGVRHRPTERVDVRFRGDADGCAEALAGQHVDRRTVPGSLDEVVEDGHRPVVRCRPPPQSVNDACWFADHGGGS